MQKFIIPPDAAGYIFKDGRQVIATRMMGGASRYRKDLAGSTSSVQVNWTTDREGYLYIRSFFQTLSYGALPFLIDLVLDQPELTEHKAYFIPESLSLNGQSGLMYSVSAELEVYPSEPWSYAEDYVAIYNEFGNTFKYYENVLDKLMNVSWPDALL